MTETVIKHKQHSMLLGLLFTCFVAIFSFALTFILFSNPEALARIGDSLWDLGVDALGAFISAALYYGCLKRSAMGPVLLEP